MIALALAAALAVQNPAPGETVRWINDLGGGTLMIDTSNQPVAFNVHSRDGDTFAVMARLKQTGEVSVRVCPIPDPPKPGMISFTILHPVGVVGAVTLTDEASALKALVHVQLRKGLTSRQRRSIHAMLAAVQRQDWPSLDGWCLGKTPKTGAK